MQALNVVLARCLVRIGSSKNLSSYNIKIKYIDIVLSIPNIFLSFLKNTQIEYRFFAPVRLRELKRPLRAGRQGFCRAMCVGKSEVIS